MANPGPKRPAEGRAAGAGDATQASTSAADRMRATEGYEETRPDAETRATPKSAKGSAPREKLTALGEFRLVKKLGAGGMGIVYKAHQQSLDRPVALKVLAKHLAASPDFVDRFYREARNMARLDHANIIHGYAVGEEHGWHYFAMEYVDGDSMETWVERLGKVSVADAVHIALRSAEALGYAHARNLVHRDIKPGNILVTSGGKVKIADLGLAKALDEDLSLTQSGTGMGTPYYMAPEQARNAKHVDGRSDIYALGATLYNLLTGKLPFEGETTVEILEAKEKGEFRPARRLNADVPERLDLILDKALAPDPNHRYQTCDELAQDLANVVAPSDRLTFIQTSAPATPQAASSSASSVLRTTAAASQTAVASEPVWYVRQTNSEGQLKTYKLSHGDVKDLIRQGRLNASTHAAHQRSGPYHALGTFPELEKLLKQQHVQARADRQAEKYNELYDQIYKQERRRRFWRRVRDYTRGVVGWAVILAILAGVAFVAVKFVWPKVQGRAQSLSETFQGRIQE